MFFLCFFFQSNSDWTWSLTLMVPCLPMISIFDSINFECFFSVSFFQSNPDWTWSFDIDVSSHHLLLFVIMHTLRAAFLVTRRSISCIIMAHWQYFRNTRSLTSAILQTTWDVSSPLISQTTYQQFVELELHVTLNEHDISRDDPSHHSETNRATSSQRLDQLDWTRNHTSGANNHVEAHACSWKSQRTSTIQLTSHTVAWVFDLIRLSTLIRSPLHLDTNERLAGLTGESLIMNDDKWQDDGYARLITICVFHSQGCV